MKTTLKRTVDPAEEIRKRSKRINTKRKLKDNVALWGLALPGFFLMLLFSYVPMFGIIIAFKDYAPRKGIFGSPWNGLDNFKFFFCRREYLDRVAHIFQIGIFIKGIRKGYIQRMFEI